MKRLLLLLCCVLTLSAPAWGQERVMTDGYRPADNGVGTNQGSYNVSGQQSTDLFNRQVKYAVPLVAVGGRGAAGYTVSLPIERGWQYGTNYDWVTQTYSPFVQARGDWFGQAFRYSPGYMQLERTQDDVYPGDPGCQNPPHPVVVLTRFKFRDMNGGETTFVDASTGGQQSSISNICQPVTWMNRGREFVSLAGDGTTFYADANVYDAGISGDFATSTTDVYGDLIFRDGLRYRIEAGKVVWIRDPNGNKVSIAYGQYGATQVVDSIGRTTSISYSTSVNDPDVITYKGFGGSSRQIKVYYNTLGNILRTGSPGLKTLAQLFPEISGLPATSFNPTLVSRLELPNGQSYYFYYTEYGDLARVLLPTGGGHDWVYVSGSGYDSSGAGVLIRRAISQAITYHSLAANDSVNAQSSNAVSTISYSASYPSGVGSRVVTVQTLDNAGVVRSQSKHYFYDQPEVLCETPFYAPWWKGREYKVEDYAVSNGVVGSVLVFRERTFNVDPQTGTACQDWVSPQLTIRVVEEKTTLYDVGLVSKVTYEYGSYGNMSAMEEYDWGSGSPGALIRRTTKNYLISQGGTNYATDLSVHIRDRVTQISVYDASSVERARTTYQYDDYTAGMVSRSNVFGHDTSTFGTSRTARGNLTATTKHDLQGGGVTASNQYDILGNVVATVDPRGNATQYDWSDNFGAPDDGNTSSNTAPSELSGLSAFAFVRKTTDPKGFEALSQHDYFIGQAVDTVDANGVRASMWHQDSLDRPTKTVRAAGTSAAQQLLTAYNDGAKTVTVTQDQATLNDQLIQQVRVYDGLGRVWREGSFEGGSDWILRDTVFDFSDKVKQRSNPYRAAGYAGAVNPSGVWTTFAFDGLGRRVSATLQDGAVVQTSFSGNTATVTDPAGRKVKQTINALGWVTQTVADPLGSPVTINFTYNVVGQRVKQSQTVGAVTQNRFWLYNALGDLVATRFPEQSAPHSVTDTVTGNGSWSNLFVYDENQNMVESTDARGVTTYLLYDELNRVTSTGFSDGTVGADYYYDRVGLAYGKGRLDYVEKRDTWGSTPKYAKTVFDSYDPMGRSLKQTHYLSTDAGVYQRSYPVEQTYDLTGQVTQVKYPSGRTVSTTRDRSGRIQTVSGNLGAYSMTYISGITYDPSGLPLKESWGTATPLYLNRHYTNRLQMYDARLGTSSTNEWEWNRGALRFYYNTAGVFGSNGTNNNGNLWRAEHFIPLNAGVSEWVMATDYLNYDALNRITSISETSEQYLGGIYTSAAAFTQTYLYDAFGNRRIDVANTTANVNRVNYDINQNTNRLVVPNGVPATVTYDAAGNLIYDSLTSSGGSNNRVFDGQGKMVTSFDGGRSDFSYDARGLRVRKKVSGSEYWSIYGMRGELLAEYAYNAAPTVVLKEYGYKGDQFLVMKRSYDSYPYMAATDALGTPRMWSDATGAFNSMMRRDYLPFGEELVAGVGVRTTGRGYPAAINNVDERQQFTGQDRDNESGLDNFGGRVYNSTAGRFISVDPVTGTLGDSQSWNGYSYVRNRPTGSTDPLGLFLPVEPTVYWVDDWAPVIGCQLPIVPEGWDLGGQFKRPARIHIITYHSGDPESDIMRRAALTKQGELESEQGFTRGYDAVVVLGIPTENNFKAAMDALRQELSRRGLKVSTFTSISHFVHNTQDPNNEEYKGLGYGQDPDPNNPRRPISGGSISRSDLSSMALPWAPGAKAFLIGCKVSQQYISAFVSTHRISVEASMYDVKASVRPDAVSDMTILQRLTQKFPIYFVPVEKVGDREEPRKYTTFPQAPYKP